MGAQWRPQAPPAWPGWGSELGRYWPVRPRLASLGTGAVTELSSEAAGVHWSGGCLTLGARNLEWQRVGEGVGVLGYRLPPRGGGRNCRKIGWVKPSPVFNLKLREARPLSPGHTASWGTLRPPGKCSGRVEQEVLSMGASLSFCRNSPNVRSRLRRGGRGGARPRPRPLFPPAPGVAFIRAPTPPAQTT